MRETVAEHASRAVYTVRFVVGYSRRNLRCRNVDEVSVQWTLLVLRQLADQIRSCPYNAT